MQRVVRGMVPDTYLPCALRYLKNPEKPALVELGNATTTALACG